MSWDDLDTQRIDDELKHSRGEVTPSVDKEERKTGISKKGKDILGVIALIAIVSSIIGLVIVMAPREYTNSDPPPTHGMLAFYIHNEDIYGNGFNVYLKGEGVPNPIGDWDFTACNDDHVDCYYTGELDFFGGTAMLHSDSSLMMYVDLPFGNYDYEIEVNSEVMASGSVFLTEDGHRESVYFHYYG